MTDHDDSTTPKDDNRVEIVFETRPVENAVDLLRALSPWEHTWESTGGATNWLFRGQRDAEWQLTPSAMRPDAFSSWGRGGPDRRTPCDLKQQLDYERRALAQFIHGCGVASLPIPEDGQWLRSEELISEAFREPYWARLSLGLDFPFHLERSLYALAQHHGVPTRFLDWTQLPLVAAYFACYEVAKARALKEELATQSDRCAVFALREPIALTRLAGNGDPQLVEVTAPYDRNPNLRAQRGTFTLVVYTNDDKDNPPPQVLPSIEQLIKAWVYRWPEPPSKEQLMLVKFTLPHAECGRLLRLLAEANVHAGTVFPSYDGVVRSLYEREWHK